MYADFAKIMKLDINENATFLQSMKIGTHKNK